MEITPEMRQAVYDADCAEKGHLLRMVLAPIYDHNYGRQSVVGPPGQIAHVTCRVCEKVWMIIEEAGDSYDDAVTKLRGRVKDPDSVQPGPRPARVTPPPHMEWSNPPI